METFEELGAAIGTVEFDREALIERALVAGRRQQRRRRLGVGAGVLAVGALAVGTSLYVAGSPSADHGGVATQPTASPGGGRAGGPSPELTDSRLVERLPVPGDLVSATNDPSGVTVERTLDPDGSGVGTVDLSLDIDRPMTKAERSGSAHKCSELAALDGPESCEPVDHGWMFTLAHDPVLASGSPKALDWSATVTYENGTSVSLHVTNYLDRHDPTRVAPVLDLDQIRQLASDPVWFEPTT